MLLFTAAQKIFIAEGVFPSVCWLNPVAYPPRISSRIMFHHITHSSNLPYTIFMPGKKTIGDKTVLFGMFNKFQQHLLISELVKGKPTYLPTVGFKNHEAL